MSTPDRRSSDVVSTDVGRTGRSSVAHCMSCPPSLQTPKLLVTAPPEVEIRVVFEKKLVVTFVNTPRGQSDPPPEVEIKVVFLKES